jgi:histidyl-tRNA synthetase
MGIKYTVNPTIVRGLDYYTKTVFEFVSTEIGAQGTICGGGRYDGLVEQVGGPKTPALGFAMGLERLMLLMKAQNVPFPEEKKCDLYIASMGDAANIKAAQIATDLRQEGFTVLYDVVGRSVKAQMKFANKVGAMFTAVLGDSELQEGKAKLKNMESGEEREISIEAFDEEFMRISINESLKELQDIGYETSIDVESILNGNLF